MNDQEKRATERVPVALRIRLRYHAVDQFISKFAVNISRGGMFLSSRNPKPPGTELYFEIRLADDSPVIEGSGEVRWIREYDRRRPDDPHGMGIQFLELSEESWPVLERIIAHRRAIGEHDEHSIPQPRSDSYPRPDSYPPPDSYSRSSLAYDDTPVPEPTARAGRAATHRDSTPAPAVDRRDGRDEALRDELVRALSPSVHASRPEESAAPHPPEADVPMVKAAVARARALTGGLRAEEALDRELAELLDESAVPVAISVEAASRELAERLGGAAVERRSAPRPTAQARPATGQPPQRAMTLDEALADEPDTPLPAPPALAAQTDRPRPG